MDDIERAAIAARGIRPRRPAIIAALARVSAVLAGLVRTRYPASDS